MCYVGKATKIFIFIITLLLVTAIVLGLGILRHGKSHKCSDNSCHQTQSPSDFPSPTVLNPGFTPPPPPPPPPTTEVITAPPPTFGPPSPVLVTPASYMGMEVAGGLVRLWGQFILSLPQAQGIVGVTFEDRVVSPVNAD